MAKIRFDGDSPVGRTLGLLARSLEDGTVFADDAFSCVLGVSYTMSFVLMFLIPARFWDDLNVFNNPDIVGMSKRSGVLLGGLFLNMLVSLPHPDLIERLFVFTGFLASAFLLRRFLTVLKLTEPRVTNAIVLLTAVLPLFQSRFQVITTYYCLSFFLFCAASLLLAQALLQRRPLLRVPAYLLLLCAFYIESFLVIYGFTLLLIALALPPRSGETGPLPIVIRRALGIIRMAPEAVLLPLLFFILKTWLTPARAEFSGYNEVTLRGIRDALIDLPRMAFDAVVDIPGDGPNWRLLAIFLMAGIFAFYARRFRAAAPSDSTPARGAAGIGLFVACCGVMLAVLPYVAVSRAVRPYDFDDRNQVTLLLVAGSVVVFAVRAFVKPRLQWALLYGVLLWAVTDNVGTYWAIIRDGHVQNAVVREMAHDRAIYAHTAFLVDTREWPYLARHRNLSTGQMNCLMKQAYGDESRFAAEYTQTPFDWNRERAFLDRYRDVGTCFRTYRGGVPLLLTVHPGAPLTTAQALKLTALYVVTPQQYEQNLEGLISLSLGPVPTGWIAPSATPH